MASCSDLHLDILGLIVTSLPNPADRARSRAVCRAWHSAVRSHERRQRLPWVVLWEGGVVTPSDGRSHRLPSFPVDGAICVGSTGSWLAVGLGRKHDFEDGTDYILHTYLLHDPFSNMSVPLTVLNDTIANIETCKIYKFLMRSTVDDFIAVVTNNTNYPIIVFRQGKGAWLPQPKTAPYIHIIDVAFLGDNLYAITRAEDLIPLDLALDSDGKPIVTIGKRVIRQPPGYDGYDAWDDEEDEEEHEEEGANDDNGDDDSNDEVEEEAEEQEEGDSEENDDNEEEVVSDDDKAPIEDDGTHDSSHSGEYTHDEETNELIIVSRHLVESRGKLLMVRRHMKNHSGESSPLTCHVDVLEADASTGSWVPLPKGTGLGGGRALFISMNFSKFVYAPYGEMEEDVTYDIETGEVFDVKSQTSSSSRFCAPFRGITWLFPLGPALTHGNLGRRPRAHAWRGPRPLLLYYVDY